MTDPGYSYTVSPDLDRLFRSFPGIAERHMTSAMKSAVTEIVAEVRPLTPVFQARLRNSIFSEVKGSGSEIVGTVGSSLSKSSPYPSVMEFGRRPGSRPPPASALERWVYLVLKVPKEEALSVAIRVARSIGKKGIPGHFFMREGFKAARPKVIKHFQTGIRDMLKEIASHGA